MVVRGLKLHTNIAECSDGDAALQVSHNGQFPH